MTSQLLQTYREIIQKELMKELDLGNIMQVPRIEKIILNVGIGSYLQRLGSKDPSFVISNVEKIAGQKPILKKARLSVSNFKLREGMPVGVVVTLRGDAAYNFVDKLVNVVFPRVRDFRGVRTNIFDKHGNCSFGFSDFTVFPEVDIPEDARKVHGLQVTIVTNTDNSEHAKALLDKCNFPFKKQN